MKPLPLIEPGAKSPCFALALIRTTSRSERGHDPRLDLDRRAARRVLVRVERERARGARRPMAAAEAFLEGAASRRIELAEFRDGYFPYQGDEIKSWIENLKTHCNPDIVFTHRRDDAHQDHREISRLTWNAFRDHLILEYEIPKWDGDLGRPNVYVAMSEDIFARKSKLLETCFRFAALQGLVRRRYVPRSRAAARNGVPGAGPLRRGLSSAQDSRRVNFAARAETLGQKLRGTGSGSTQHSREPSPKSPTRRRTRTADAKRSAVRSSAGVE